MIALQQARAKQMLQQCFSLLTTLVDEYEENASSAGGNRESSGKGIISISINYHQPADQPADQLAQTS